MIENNLLPKLQTIWSTILVVGTYIMNVHILYITSTGMLPIPTQNPNCNAIICVPWWLAPNWNQTRCCIFLCTYNTVGLQSWCSSNYVCLSIMLTCITSLYYATVRPIFVLPVQLRMNDDYHVVCPLYSVKAL